MEHRTLLLPLAVVVTTLLVSTTWQQLASAAECQRRCGGVDIPYPFGIGRGCFLESPDMAFSLTCNLTAGDGNTSTRRPFSGALELLDVRLGRGQVRVRNRISSWCGHNGTPSMASGGSQLLPSSFRVSDAANRFTVIGCDALAYVGADADNGVIGMYSVGCRSMCPSAARLANGSSCSGMGCCQAAVPPGLSRYQVWFEDELNSSSSGRGAMSRPCSYAVLVEAAAFEFRTTYVTTGEFMEATGGQVPLVLDWVAGNQTCLEAKTQAAGYKCLSGNSECVDSRNGPGYLCNCSAGYQGNPYVLNGCQGLFLFP